MRVATLFSIAFLAATSAFAVQPPALPSLPVPPVNHVYVVVDPQTYATISTSRRLTDEIELGSYETRTTVRKDRTYSGTYFYFGDTYLEFLDPASKDAKVGSGGLALAVETPGDLQQWRPRLGLDLSSVTRANGKNDLLWFWMGAPRSVPERSPLRIWLMEYDPAFLSAWHPEAGGQSGVARRLFLARYRALAHSVLNPIVRDVIGMTIALEPSIARPIGEALVHVGWKLEKENNETTLTGPRFTLRIVPQTAARNGVQNIRLDLQRLPRSMDSIALGSSTITFDPNRTALWSFAQSK